MESLIWEHSGNTLPVNHRQKVDQLNNGVGGKLHVHNVHRSQDQGEYSCTAKGSAGKLAKGSVRVHVKVAPVIDLQPLPDKIYTNEGMRVKLMCSIVEGDAPVDIKWFKGGTMINSGRGISLQNSEDYSLLTFKSVTYEDLGNW